MVTSKDRATLGGLAGVAVWTFLILPFLYCVQADAAPEGKEFWPPVWGYSLKVTDTLVVASTFCLFLATFALWWATKKLVDGAAQTAERQLRAYVFARPKALQKGANNQWECKIEIENSGQTPAYSVTQLTREELLAEPTSEQNFNIEDDITYGSKFSIPPGGNAFTTARRTLSQNDVDQIQAGNQSYYIFGQIKYLDAFDKWRSTKFRFVHNHSAFGTNEILACSTGNEET